MMAYPSINAAAAALGLHTQNLNQQIQRLETDIGAPIVQRAAHRCAPMVATRRGQRLLDHLAQPAVRDLLGRYANANARPKCGPYKRSAQQ
jgi:DNA-binding transcriptional LysR family regulator